MLPLLTQPAVAPACYKPRAGSAIGQSLVFGGAQWLSRTFGGAAPDLTKATINVWLSLDDEGGTHSIHHTYRDSTPTPGRKFFSFVVDQSVLRVIETGQEDAPPTYYNITTSRKLRDLGKYVNIHVEIDTEQASPADRVKIYINKVRETAFSTATYPPLGYQTALCLATTHYLGRYWDQINQSNVQGLRGRLAMDYLIRGRALPPDDFVETNIHGVCVPRALVQGGAAADTCLDFADPLDPGKDVSGQGNHWTAVGFDPSGRDTVASTPTNRYAALNALDVGTAMLLSGGNLEVSRSVAAADYQTVMGDIVARSGKLYAEIECDFYGVAARYQQVGISAEGRRLTGPQTNGPLSWGLMLTGDINVANQGLWHAGGKIAGYDGVWATGDVCRIKVDLDAGELTFGRGETWFAPVAIPAGLAWRLFVSAYSDGAKSSALVSVNTGQRPWVYGPPAGYGGWCTGTLPEPDIKDPSEALAQATATGADIVSVLDALTAHWGDAWVEIIKRRDAAEDWRVRFADDPANAWATNNANAKGPAAALAPGGAYVGYRLRVGQRYGVWTAEVEHVNGTPTTVTHGLDTARNMVIATRVSTDGGDRYCHHPDMPVGVLGKLNTNVQPAADGTLTAIEASSFEIAAGAPSGTYRVLVLAHRPGWLEIGSYKGTGQAGNNGAFDPMGIAPMWQLVKRLDNSGAWMLSSTALAPVNPMIRHLDLDKSNPEYTTGSDLDMVVGGVKYRTAGHNTNDTNGTYLRVAIGRPVGGVCVAPATAR